MLSKYIILQFSIAFPLNFRSYIVSDIQKRGIAQSLPEQCFLPIVESIENPAQSHQICPYTEAQANGIGPDSLDTNHKLVPEPLKEGFKFHVYCDSRVVTNERICDSVKIAAQSAGNRISKQLKFKRPVPVQIKFVKEGSSVASTILGPKYSKHV